ncbi:hypothetical protein GCM10023200_37360 [Actinomycetospora chlora]|uniref:RNA polymerase sigma-70 region 2 domain-containing protein n=1 Tax=Actinomycetospora chlora TaxID=663608 RepID=A0ABP9BMV0_9PSEU
MTVEETRPHRRHRPAPDTRTGPIATDGAAVTTGPRLVPTEVARLPRPRHGGPGVATGPLRVSDASLAAAAPTSPTAFAAIYRRYGDALHDFCLGMLRDRDAAADCVQDVFCVAATRLDQLREHDKLRPWLYAIARHEALARLRRRRREQPTDAMPDGPSAGDGPDALAARTELAELVAAAAGGLADRDRTVLELHYRHGLDGPELADALGVSATHANTLVGRLRTTVERCLGALLVARHRRAECAELDALLGGWDGGMTVLLRKRLNRHIEGCAGCRDARGRLVSPTALLASAPVAVPAPGWLGDSIARHATPMLQPGGGSAGTSVSWWPAGLGGGTHASAAVLAPIVAAVVVAPVLTVAVLTAGSTAPDVIAGPGAPAPAPSAVSPTGAAPTGSSSPPSGRSTGPTASVRPQPGAPGTRPGVRPGQPAVPLPRAPLGPFSRPPALPEAPPVVPEPPDPRDDELPSGPCEACTRAPTPGPTGFAGGEGAPAGSST